MDVSRTWPILAFTALSHLTHLSDSRSCGPQCRSVFLAEIQQMSVTCQMVETPSIFIASHAET